MRVKESLNTLSKKCSNFLLRVVSFHKSCFAFFICLLATVLVYRIQLSIGLFTNPIRPFDFNPAQHSVWLIFSSWPSDLALILICFLFAWILSRGVYVIKSGKAIRLFKVFGIISFHFVLFILLLIHGVHGRLLFDVQTGLDVAAIKEASSSISLIETIPLIAMKDYLYLLFPFALFWLVRLSALNIRIWMARVSILLIISLSGLSIFSVHGQTKEVPREVRLNPTLFLLYDIAENVFLKDPGENRNLQTVKETHSRLSPSPSIEGQWGRLEKSLPPQSIYPWNVILFIMESVGTRYIFDTSYGNPMPMPFLYQISKKGWFLKHHYTTSNVSTKAVFSLLSGLYDFFKRENFGTREDAEVPAIYNWLGEGYDRFLVTPSSISWYFPTRFIKNSGLREIHSYENLRFEIKEELNSLGRYIARDEVQTVNFFIQRLSQAREPFLGIYISFAAHFPYFDYGEEYRIMKEDGHLISRYYNNLNLLDCMIKRVVDRLKEQGLMERTILVIVGDHGQAFGQHHPNNFMHYRYSYNENLETPAIFYQPALFQPKTIEFPTSHVDILPTLLDAMRIPYPSMAFEGNSLFNHPLRRHSIFFYGYEESISSLDTHLIKVQYSLKKKKCWAFNLKVDPEENNPLDCSLYPVQVENLHQFTMEHDLHLIQRRAGLSYATPHTP